MLTQRTTLFCSARTVRFDSLLFTIWRVSSFTTRKSAAEIHVDAERLIERVATMAAALPDLVTTVRGQIESEGLSHPTIGTLSRRLQARAKSCRNTLKIRATRQI